MPLLQAQHIGVTLGSTPIVHDISLSVREKQIVALLGPNGAGKTTLLRAIIGLLPLHTRSTLTFAKQNITHIKTDQRVAAGLIYLPQHTSLFKALSVQENLEVIFDYHPYWHQKSRTAFEEECDRHLTLIHLKEIKNRKAGVLSGGQKRKLELVRALIMHPRLILCDEPFAGVDPKSISELKTLLEEIVTHQEISILISDHNVDQLISIADYLYVVLEGTVATQGTIETIMSDKATREQYLGESFHKEMRKRFLR